MNTVEYVDIGRRFTSTEVTAVQGPMHLRVWRGPEDATWYASAFLYALIDGKRTIAGHVSVDSPTLGFRSHVAAIDALNDWADKLGPVEPWLALFAFFHFDRNRNTKRRVSAERRAA